MTKPLKVYISLLLITLTFVFSYLLIGIETLEVQDLVMLVSLIGVIILSVILSGFSGFVFGLTLILFYSLFVFYQTAVLEMSIWTSQYVWFLAFPSVIFLAGQVDNHIQKLGDQSEQCDLILDSVVGLDEITGYRVAKEFYKDLGVEMSKSKRHKTQFTLGIIKIQYFQELQSIFGVKGTRSIYENIAKAVSYSTRLEDLKYRLNEDTLALILPHTSQLDANIVKDRMKSSLNQLQIDSENKSSKYNIELKVGLLEYKTDIENPMKFKKLAMKELEYDV